MRFLHSGKVQSVKMLWLYSKAVTEAIRSPKCPGFTKYTGGMKPFVVLIHVCVSWLVPVEVKIHVTQFLHPGLSQSLGFLQDSRAHKSSFFVRNTLAHFFFDTVKVNT